MSDTNEPPKVILQPGEHIITVRLTPGRLVGQGMNVNIDMGGLSPVTVANIFCGFSAQVLTQIEQEQQRAAQMQAQGVIAPPGFRKN